MKRGLLVVLVLLVNFACAADIYVDQDLSSDCTGGDYNVGARTCGGSAGDAYRTVQGAIDAVGAGDVVYMRGGTYNENRIIIPAGRSGTSGSPITLRSYPGEWAVIDAGHGASEAVISYGINGNSPLRYWIFKKFEVTGGGTSIGASSRGGGLMFDTGSYLTFEYLYIHDNYGGGSYNDGGICIKNENYAPQYNVIRYCHFKDNGDPSNFNTGNIVLFADYRDPPNINFETTRRNNEIYYNLIEGGAKGIKSKNDEGMTNDNSASNMEMKENGDKIHHNIVRDFRQKGIEGRQDFIQIYNNIVISDHVQSGIKAGCDEFNTDREPFYATVYNNMLIGVDLSVEHQADGLYGPPYHPYIYFYNNIVEDVGSAHNDGRNDINILFGYTSRGENAIDMDTVFVENNLLYGRSASDAVIETGGNGNEYSAASFVAAGYASEFYATTASGLHPGSDEYEVDGSFVLEGSTTVADGGLGGAHPYLDGVSIPSYVGAINPDDGDWVDGVLGLDDVGYLRDASEGGPDWVEGVVASSCGNDVCDAGECNSCVGDCTFSYCCGLQGCNANIGETCDSCDEDCGVCSCDENWNCTDWECVDEQSVRTCVDLNSCGTVDEKPGEVGLCDEVEVVISVDSSYPDYVVDYIDDDVVNAGGGTSATWASESADEAHWVLFEFSEVVEINFVEIYWGYNNGQLRFMSSQEVWVQYWDGSGYVNASVIENSGEVESSNVTFSEVSTSRLRLFQPVGMGYVDYPRVMWLTEVDYGLVGESCVEVTIDDVGLRIGEWKSGLIGIDAVLDVVEEWKAGC